jgi:2-polyprenyl-3-methyl-5-hydroxy-6-metoxy-1,4-benzoquinol methylase
VDATSLGGEFAKPDGYFHCEREEMVAFIPAAAETVLDVGCGAGGFGRSLKRYRPGVHVAGVEINPDAADEAAKIYDTVWVGSFPEVVSDVDGVYDCVVFNDVLEHLVDPWGALRASSKILTPDGRIVASIPNVRYLPVLYNLLVHAQWTYEQTGVLDRTHVRFFTKRSIQDLFDLCGFSVIKVEGIHPLVRWQTTLLRTFVPPLRDTQFIEYAVVAKHNDH